MRTAEIKLTGGRTTPRVVRLGDTVRRPLSSGSAFVHDLLRHLEAKGFEGAPRFLGLDDKGREVLTFLPGEVPAELEPFSNEQLDAAARLLRSLHDATVDCALGGADEIVCHGDPSPCNCVFVDGVPRALIDFDAAHSGSRAEDLGYAAWLWLDIGNRELAPEEQGRRLASFVSAYDPRMEADPVELVVQAQVRFSEKLNGPPGNREWARACLAWTRRHRAHLQAGATS
jgi:phosphotransferase family enzyme